VPFALPEYHPPNFDEPPLVDMLPVNFRPVAQPGVAPEEYHATSIFPEYYQIRKGDWRLLQESRMDCVVVMERDGHSRPGIARKVLTMKEFRAA